MEDGPEDKSPQDNSKNLSFLQVLEKKDTSYIYNSHSYCHD